MYERSCSSPHTQTLRHSPVWSSWLERIPKLTQSIPHRDTPPGPRATYSSSPPHSFSRAFLYSPEVSFWGEGERERLPLPQPWGPHRQRGKVLESPNRGRLNISSEQPWLSSSPEVTETAKAGCAGQYLTTGSLGKKALICSICQFLWCKYFPWTSPSHQ